MPCSHWTRLARRCPAPGMIDGGSSSGGLTLRSLGNLVTVREGALAGLGRGYGC